MAIKSTRFTAGSSLGQIFFYLTLSVMHAGCGGENNASLNPNSPKFLYERAKFTESRDADLEPLLTEFISAAASYGVPAADQENLIRLEYVDSLAIGKARISGFGSTFTHDSMSVGVCLEGSEENNINGKTIRNIFGIFIDSSFRGHERTYLAKALLWHEFAHCLLGAPHVEEVRGLGSKNSYFNDAISRWERDNNSAKMPPDVFEELKRESHAAWTENAYALLEIMNPTLLGDEEFWEEFFAEKEENLFSNAKRGFSMRDLFLTSSDHYRVPSGDQK